MKERLAALLMAFALARPVVAARAPAVTAVEFGARRLSVEVVDTDAGRAQGLMDRDALPADAGMLFVYQDAKPREFWMKNTKVPLSVCFLDAAGRILNIVEEMKPLDESVRYPSAGPARYAVEANAHWFSQAGVKKGDLVRFAYRYEKIEGVAFEHAMVKVETVDRSDTVERGLMFRDKLAEDAGMLFVFPVPQQLRFWMKNTKIPLSIAFMDVKRKVLNIRDMEPYDETTRHLSNGIALYALEVNKGWFDRHGVKAGEVARFLQSTTEKVAPPGLEAPSESGF